MTARTLPLALAALAISLAGCEVDLGACNDDLARTVYYADSNGLGVAENLPMYGGQALLHSSCGLGTQCHSRGAVNFYRNGVPATFDFDMAIDQGGATVNSIDVERLRAGQARIYENRHNIYSQVLDGNMPPGERGRLAAMGAATFSDGSGRPLPDVRTPEAHEILRNWLACGSPVVERTTGPIPPVPLVGDIAPARDCRAATDCRPGETCLEGLCHVICATGADCAPMIESCIGGACQTITPCTNDAECGGPGHGCIAGRCRLVCMTDGDCPPGIRCTDGACTYPAAEFPALWATLLGPQCGLACHTPASTEQFARNHLDMSTPAIAYLNLVGMYPAGPGFPAATVPGQTAGVSCGVESAPCSPACGPGMFCVRDACVPLRRRVDPGNPDISTLVNKLENCDPTRLRTGAMPPIECNLSAEPPITTGGIVCGDIMPLGGPASGLCFDCYIRPLRDWIAAGAPETPP